MWTNVFKIGGLHQISWFQFLPHESDVNSLVDTSLKLDKKDAATWLVLSSHLQLQKEGFLSTWTNSFVGPWDPSQGLYNPDEKIKLWLFFPGQHSSVVDKAQSTVSKLRVLGSGLWVAPGDSEEVAAALSQALRNCMERTLRGLSYVRYGDVFTKYRPFSQNEELFRKGHPVVEFIFSATEEAIFVHVIISAKHIRALSSGDIDKISGNTSNVSGEGLPVIVSPHGMRGRLTGCCPADLVKQVYLSSDKFNASNGVVGLPCNVKGQNSYVEISLGCTALGNNNVQGSSNIQNNSSRPTTTETSAMANVQSKIPDNCGRVLIYAPEAVLVPVVQTACARSSLKRFWLQNWIGPSLSFTSSFMHCFDFHSDAKVNSMDGSWLDANAIRSNRRYNSSSNSNSSSISSISTSSSDSDYKTSGTGDLEADADSLMCRQSGLSSLDRSQNDNLKTGFKRSRTGASESFSQGGAVINPSTSDFASMEVNNSAITAGNDQIGLQWGWDDDDRDVGMDIQALLSEFGDFGDFFENDALPFGEPPGTAESQALMFPAADSMDVGSSPCPSAMDMQDQLLLPAGFPSFDSFNQPAPPAILDDSLSKHQEVIKSTAVANQVNGASAFIAGEFDHLIKAEALMSFAPEYGAIETSTGESSHLIFRNPYVPKSREVETANSSSNSYVYSATPPLSPCFDACEEKSGVIVNLKTGSGRPDTNSIVQSKKYYTHVESGKEKKDDKSSGSLRGCATRATQVAQSPFSGFNSTNSVQCVHNKIDKANEGLLKTGSCGQSIKTVLATEVECLMCQAFMCKMRHTLLSSSGYLPVGRMSGSTIRNQSQGEALVNVDNTSSKSEMKKKEIIPVRIAGDIDGGLLDGTLNAPVGVWRSVGASKGMKQQTAGLESGHSVQHTSFIEESMLAYGLRPPLQELLDGMPLLVQQATSLVDIALDADSNDGSYGWLALQEQWRRGFSCRPSMVHAGCGGVLASCHSLDIAGVELIDPLSAGVQASFTLTLLQNDIKAALKSAFGTMEGPLSVVDWCKGHGQSNDGGLSGDGFCAESTASASECRDSSSSISLSVGEPISPSQSSAGGSSSLRDGTRVDEASDRRLSQDTCLSESEQLPGSRLRPTLAAVPYPALLVGYQDDWLKTSPSSLQFWEKAPFEPYAMPKPMTYYVVCPDINALTTAATDFFQQLGTVYETCKLGTHSPQSMGNEMEIDSGKNAYSGFVLIDCPQSMKIDSTNASMLGSISDYFLSLSNGWDLESYLKSLSKVLRNLKLSSCMTVNPKEGSAGPCTVIYVVCPFPEPLAVLQTVIESSVAVGSVVLSSDKERRCMLHNQVGKALSYSAAVDEALSNVLTLSGFCIPKLVLQIVTVDSIFRVTSPALSELVILKEIAFTVYNKARRISRRSTSDMVQSSSMSGRSHPVLMQMNSPVPGIWKDCVGPRTIGTSLQREADLDASLRPGSWDNWQTSRGGGLGCEPNRIGDFSFQDETRYLFEPLYILAEPGSLDRGLSFPMSGNPMTESSKLLLDDGTSGSFMQSSASSGGDTGVNTQSEASEPDGFGSKHQKSFPSLHCCYGWTEDWRWLVCMWTDSRGELLDNQIYPFGGISSRQDTKGLQSLFVQILQQGCHILQACPPEAAIAKPRDFVIARIGCFLELECQEWQKALYSVGGSDVKKWSLQLRRSVPDGVTASSNGTSLQQQEIGLIQERAPPSSPSPLYSPHSKASSFMKGGLGQPSTRKQLIGGQGIADNSRGLLQWVQSISFVSLSVDHSLQLMFQADSMSHGTSQISGIMSQPGYLEGYTPVKSLGSTSTSYILIPSPSMRFLPPVTLQLPTCLTAESPPLAHLLHSKGCAIPLSTGFVVSKAVPTMRRDVRSISKEEWPSVLSVSLVDHYGGSSIIQKFLKGVGKVGGRGTGSETREVEIAAHLILENIAAELHALSWMTVSPAYLERRSALPFHCDMVLRLRRLLHFADKEVSRQPEKSQV